MNKKEFKVLPDDKYKALTKEEKIEYINSAIKKYGTRSKAYIEMGKNESTIRKWCKSNGFVFDAELNIFIADTKHSSSIEKVKQQSDCIAGAKQEVGPIEGMQSTSLVNAEQKDVILNEICKEWDVLKKIISEYKSKNNKDIIDIDTSIKVKDLPESDVKTVNLRLNKEVWEEFNQYITKKHKGISQKNMVEIALLQYIRDKR